MNTKNTILIPTQLFVGPKDFLLEQTENYLQQEFCETPKQENLNDCFCKQCRKIKNQQHESIVFISPEKNYLTKDIEIIFEKTSLSLDNNKKFFFILQKANTLNTASANRLLKILEEPPTGYNFILHTNNINSILPTIISRCHITNFAKNTEFETIDPEFIIFTNFFFNKDLDNPFEFSKELKKLRLSDNQSIEIANYLIDYYSQKIINHYKKSNRTSSDLQHFQNIYDYLINKMSLPPLSGSSNLFWKNVYISFPKK